MAGLQQAGLSEQAALASINRMIDQQAFMLAANDVFYGSAVIFLFLIPLVWLSHPPKNGGRSGTGAAAGAH